MDNNLVEIVKEVVVSSINRSLKNKGWNGKKWPRRKTGEPSSLGMDSKLAGSIRVSTEGNKVVVKTFDYGKFVNEGTSKFSPRQFIGIDDKGAKEIEKKLKELIHNKLMQHF